MSWRLGICFSPVLVEMTDVAGHVGSACKAIGGFDAAVTCLQALWIFFVLETPRSNNFRRNASTSRDKL